MLVSMKFEEIRKPRRPISDTLEVWSVIIMQKPRDARRLQNRSRQRM